jgi:hypothetical protein
MEVAQQVKPSRQAIVVAIVPASAVEVEVEIGASLVVNVKVKESLLSSREVVLVIKFLLVVWTTNFRKMSLKNFFLNLVR